MTRFIQLHLLTAYPPANLNRDDTGRPKTAVFGGVPRLRVSSQSLKRAYRTSEVFANALEGHLASRTKRLGGSVIDHLVARDASPERAREIAEAIAARYGKLKKGERETRAEIEQLAFISPTERDAAFALAERMLAGEEPDVATEPLLTNAHGAADIAMFGRMLADVPPYNCEAAVQVAHAITTHKVVVEDDYFTGVDDLKEPSAADAEGEERGAGHIGIHEFGSGLFYLYACVDWDLLVGNLDGDEALARSALAALAEAAATVSPKGKRASYASNARAHYVLAERGGQQPRTLAAAFMSPVDDDDPIGESIKGLETLRDRMDGAYGACADARSTMNVAAGEGTLAEVVAFVAE